MNNLKSVKVDWDKWDFQCMIKEEAEKLYSGLLLERDEESALVMKSIYELGAREFIKRTEERVWREAVKFSMARFRNSDETFTVNEIAEIMADEGKRKGYIK